MTAFYKLPCILCSYLEISKKGNLVDFFLMLILLDIKT